MEHQAPGPFMVQQHPQPVAFPPTYGIPSKSCPLIGFGITLIIFSLAAGGLAFWAVSFEVNQYYAYANVACSGFFLLTGILATYGGQDIGQRHCSITTSLVLGILGIIIAVVGIITNTLALLWFGENCRYCDIQFDSSRIGVSCTSSCIIAYFPVHIGLMVITILMAILGLILSCSACCNVCKCCCCYKEPIRGGGGFMLPPAPITNVVMGMQQRSVPYRQLSEEQYNIQGPGHSYEAPDYNDHVTFK